MSEESRPLDGDGRGRSRVPTMLGLLAIVTAEFLAVAAVTIVFLVDLVTSHASSASSAVALVVLTAIAAVGLGAVVVGLVRARSWVRGATIVWQFVQIAVGVGCLEGVVRTTSIGWVLIVVAVGALVLVFSPPVTRVLARRER